MFSISFDVTKEADNKLFDSFSFKWPTVAIIESIFGGYNFFFSYFPWWLNKSKTLIW